jgi:integrase
MSFKATLHPGNGSRYWIHGTVARRFYRLPLGTANFGAASKAVNRIEGALAEGANSALWPELKRNLPARTFETLAAIAHYREAAPAKVATWKDLEAAFAVWMHRKILLGKLAESTRERYQQTLRAFNAFLVERGVSELPAMNVTFFEDFKVWRLERIREKKFSRGGRGLVLDVAILHKVFAVGMDRELVTKNPVKFEGRPGAEPERGAQTFTGTELAKLRQSAGKDLLAYLLLRWTGFRGSDVVALTWGELDFENREIKRLTQKRKKTVTLPIPQELLFALEAERDRRLPSAGDRVLLNPLTGAPMTRPRLYQRMLALGLRAGVANAHPHRYRDSYAVNLMVGGASLYEVAKLLGDTAAMVEKHYLDFVSEMRDKARRILDGGEGLEKIHCSKITRSDDSATWKN